MTPLSPRGMNEMARGLKYNFYNWQFTDPRAADHTTPLSKNDTHCFLRIRPFYAPVQGTTVTI
jgi:hypothetical protein